VPAAAPLAWAFVAWQLTTLCAGVVAWLCGARADAAAGASALAMAPGFAGLALLPRLGEKSPQLILLTVWLSALGFLIAGAGGAASPLAACLIVPPALCAALGLPRASETGAAALLVYAIAVLVAAFGAPAVGLGVFPQLLAVIAIAFASAMIAIAVARGQNQEVAASAHDPIAELAHELRTPLTQVMGFADILRQQLFGQVGARNLEYAEFIHQSGAHMLDITDELLEAARIGAGKRALSRETFDARALVEEAAKHFAESARAKQIDLSVGVPETALLVNADKRALRRILTNMLGNAVKFTPEGGRVRVEARAADGQFVLDSSDSGPGIAPAERARLGQPFVRGETGALAEGTGLGLSLVRALAGLHGGALSFHDAAEGGALVRVSAPILADASAAP
jgi:signal transduction histidine kinase